MGQRRGAWTKGLALSVAALTHDDPEPVSTGAQQKFGFVDQGDERGPIRARSQELEPAKGDSEVKLLTTTTLLSNSVVHCLPTPPPQWTQALSGTLSLLLWERGRSRVRFP